MGLCFTVLWTAASIEVLHKSLSEPGYGETEQVTFHPDSTSDVTAVLCAGFWP